MKAWYIIGVVMALILSTFVPESPGRHRTWGVAAPQLTSPRCGGSCCWYFSVRLGHWSTPGLSRRHSERSKVGLPPNHALEPTRLVRCGSLGSVRFLRRAAQVRVR
jgi:hypothetical protein